MLSAHSIHPDFVLKPYRFKIFTPPCEARTRSNKYNSQELEAVVRQEKGIKCNLRLLHELPRRCRVGAVSYFR